MRIRRGIGAAALACLLLTGSAAAADQNIGCGLGSILWEGQDDLFFQVIGATTNGVFGIQTFGISSNTLGCKRNQVITAEHRVNMFAGANFDQIAREMAAGEGEALTTLAVLMSIEEGDRPAFYQLTKQNFVSLFATDEATSGDMLEELDRLMGESPALRHYTQG